MEKETLDKLQEAMRKVIEAVKEVIRKIVDYVRKVAPVFRELILSQADSKTVHLAKHGKNRRIRKKNSKKAIQQGLRRMGVSKWQA